MHEAPPVFRYGQRLWNRERGLARAPGVRRPIPSAHRCYCHQRAILNVVVWFCRPQRSIRHDWTRNSSAATANTRSSRRASPLPTLSRDYDSVATCVSNTRPLSAGPGVGAELGSSRGSSNRVPNDGDQQQVGTSHPERCGRRGAFRVWIAG